MTIGRAMIAAALVLAASQASAQAYLGGSVGQSDIDEQITTGLITGGSVDGKDNAFKIFGGYMFNRHFGIEGAYVDLGEVSYSGNFFGTPVTGGRVEVTGINISLGVTGVESCPAFDADGDGNVFVDEIVRGANNALEGCG